MPYFVVDEGTREHAAEFAFHTGLVRLDTHKEISTIRYSEKYVWETGQFDALTHALAQYYKSERRWVFIQAFTAGADGRRSLAHASLIRHYLSHCGTWTSSYRLVLGLLEEVDDTPHFSRKALSIGDKDSFEEIAEQALWDVIFARLSTIQEYGWHAGLKELAWASDELNGSLGAMDWSKLQPELASFRHRWAKTIVTHAKDHQVYFPSPDSILDEDHED